MDYCTIATVAAFMAGFMAALPVVYLVLAAKMSGSRKLPADIDCPEWHYVD